MAMVLAGVPMKGMVASVCCAVHQEGQITVDPSSEEEKVLLANFHMKSFSILGHFNFAIGAKL